METQYFRISDPLENFRIKVVVREVGSHAVGDARSETQSFNEGFVLSWQEKVPGPHDIVDLLKKKELDGSINKAGLRNVMLYTRVDDESFVPFKKAPAISSKPMGSESYLGFAMHGDLDGDAHDYKPNVATNVDDQPGNRVGTPSASSSAAVKRNAREIRVRDRISREKEFEDFYICIATDVDVEGLLAEPWDPKYFYTENILCAIRLHEDGLVEVSPGMSSIIDEPTSDALTGPTLSVGVASQSQNQQHQPPAGQNNAAPEETAQQAHQPGTAGAARRAIGSLLAAIPGARRNNIEDPARARVNVPVNSGFGVSVGSWGKPTDAEGDDVHHALTNPMHGLTPSVYMDDKTLTAGLSKGFRLSTFRVLSKSGREFEYIIQNLNASFSPPQSVDPALTTTRGSGLSAGLTETVLSGAARLRQRQEETYGAFKQDPPASGYDKSMAIYAEIVSATGFDGFDAKLFVSYEMMVPINCSLRTGNLVDGAAEKDIIRTKVGANLLAVDGFADGIDAEGALSGTTQTARVTHLNSCQTRLRERPHWRGVTLSHSLPPLSRALLGYSFFFCTVLAVILGPEYPFWVLPALVILFNLGTGYPGGANVQVVLAKHRSQREDAVSSVLGRDIGGGASVPKKQCGKSSAVSSREFRAFTRERAIAGSTLTPSIAHFNHLVNMSFDVKEIPWEAREGSSSSYTPSFVFEVYRVGLMGRNILEGYGYFTVPEKADSIDVTIKTWRPVGGISAKLNEQFLGGAAHIHDLAYVNGNGAKSINRFGVQSESRGSIRLRVNSVVTDPRAKPRAIEVDGGNASAGGVGAGAQKRRTVEDILANFRRSRVGGMGSVATSMSASNKSLLRTSLGSSHDGPLPKPDVSSVLARAKAKIAAFKGTSSSGDASSALSSQQGSDIAASVATPAALKALKEKGGNASSASGAGAGDIAAAISRARQGPRDPLPSNDDSESAPLIGIASSGIIGSDLDDAMLGERKVRRHTPHKTRDQSKKAGAVGGGRYAADEAEEEDTNDEGKVREGGGGSGDAIHAAGGGFRPSNTKAKDSDHSDEKKRLLN